MVVRSAVADRRKRIDEVAQRLRYGLDFECVLDRGLFRLASRPAQCDVDDDRRTDAASRRHRQQANLRLALPASDGRRAAIRWPGQLTLLAALLGGLAIGLSLGLLGSGGSILTVPVLHYLLQQPEQVAIGGSLLVVGLIATAACIPYAVARQVDWRNVLWFGLPGMLGAWLGASLARWVPGPAQLALFAVVMLVAAWRMLSSATVGDGDRKPHPLAILAGGTAVGSLSGLVGVGGGFLIVPALVLLAGVPMTSAVGTSLAIIAMNSFTGFGKYLQVLEAKGVVLDWRTLLLIAAIGVVGSLAGNRLGRRLPQASLRRLFGVFLVVMGLFVAADVGPTLLH